MAAATRGVIPYQEQIQNALRALDTLGDDQRSRFLNLMDETPERCLKNYSTKLHEMLYRITDESNKGSNLVYSQFKTVEGLGVLAIALKANGFVPIEITGSEQNPTFSAATMASFQKGPAAKEKRYIMFTGEGSKEHRTLVLNIFNGNFHKLPHAMREVLAPYAERKNNYGEICWVIGITGAGAEGISLKCCRSVHIMEPYWNNVRLDQVKGRAIRICSHKDLPFAERTVNIYTYVTGFSKTQIPRIDPTILNSDSVRVGSKVTPKTSDQNVLDVSTKKEKISKELLQVMKECAVDCDLNKADNDVTCIKINGRADKYMFDPNLEMDILITGIELKEKPAETASKASKELTVIKIKGIEYVIQEKKGAGGLVYNLFPMDGQMENPVGTIQEDPVQRGRYFGVNMI